MKQLDRFIQRWRMRRAMRFIPGNARVIDIGAHEGELFTALGGKLVRGFGVEPLRKTVVDAPNFVIVPGFFPSARPAEGGWNAVTMLAVLEHIPTKAQAELAAACCELLEKGGRVIITVPSKAVDHILIVLRWLRLIDGMSLEEHYGFEPGDTEKIFGSPGFRLIHRSKFQLGLNHLLFSNERLKCPGDDGTRAETSDSAAGYFNGVSVTCRIWKAVSSN